jgi:FtsH-binding integral membrane protein
LGGSNSFPAIMHNHSDCEDSRMKEWLKDTVGLGIVLWLIGYLASMALFLSPFAGIMGWIITAVFTPVTIVITWWWFRARDLPLAYYAGVGIVWTVIAVVLDYLFIVLLFQATYYAPDVFLYYALTFLIPVGVGYYLVRTHREPLVKQG